MKMRFSEFQKHGSLVENNLVPYLEIIDIVRVASVNRAWRTYFEPRVGFRPNWSMILLERAGMEPQDDEYVSIEKSLARAAKFIDVLKILARNVQPVKKP
jgi:hypothetical protein